MEENTKSLQAFLRELFILMNKSQVIYYIRSLAQADNIALHLVRCLTSYCILSANKMTLYAASAETLCRKVSAHVTRNAKPSNQAKFRKAVVRHRQPFKGRQSMPALATCVDAIFVSSRVNKNVIVNLKTRTKLFVCF